MSGWDGWEEYKADIESKYIKRLEYEDKIPGPKQIYQMSIESLRDMNDKFSPLFNRDEYGQVVNIQMFGKSPYIVDIESLNNKPFVPLVFGNMGECNEGIGECDTCGSYERVILTGDAGVKWCFKCYDARFNSKGA